MKRDPSELLKEALELAPEVRAALAGSLLESLDDTLDPDVEAAWNQEITHRIQELNGTKIRPIPWSEARRLIVGG